MSDHGNLEEAAHEKKVRGSQPPIQTPSSLHPGRYISKRERAAAATATTTPPHPAPVGGQILQGCSYEKDNLKYPFIFFFRFLVYCFRALFLEVRDILNVEIPYHVLKTLRNIVPHAANYNRLPKGRVAQLEGHTKGVNAVRWSPTHVSLLASAGMDHQAIVWNVWANQGQQMLRRLSSHKAAVKDIQWTVDGRFLLSCGFDKTCRLTDVDLGLDVQDFSDDQFINAVKFHPLDRDVFLSGGSNGALKLWDIRTGKSEKAYLSRSLGPVMDVDFSADGKHFVSTSDMVKRHSSDKAIVVWDYDTQVALSNQVYIEAYTCPCVRYHPFEQTFIAQSNANYIAIFSAKSPFKMDKYKRYEGHQVSAHPIQCNFSPCGGFVVTGSADGHVHIYNYRSSKLLRKLEAHRNACTDVSYHPVLPSVMASCSWDGMIFIYE
ncbi:unnamed protein product [Calypogeia fissa]